MFLKMLNSLKRTAVAYGGCVAEAIDLTDAELFFLEKKDGLCELIDGRGEF